MKQRNFITGTMLMLLATGVLRAQTDEATKNADAIDVGVGGTFGKIKVMKNLDKFAIAQITVDYKLTSTERTVSKDKGSGKIAGAKITAYLETTDGELTTADFQEITDKFYSYFQRKLKENGIDTVGWNTIAASDFYKSADDRNVSEDEVKKSGQVWVSCNANKGNILHQGIPGFAFGKAKRAGHFVDDIGAPAGVFALTVDFADLMVNLDIKTSGGSAYPSGYYPYSTTTTYKYHAATKPIMSVVPTSRTSTLVWNEKLQTESITLTKDLPSDMVYHTALNQDPSRLKNNLFAFAKSMDPVVVETTREKYKAAAGKALEKYADAFVAKTLQLRKG